MTGLKRLNISLSVVKLSAVLFLGLLVIYFYWRGHEFTSTDLIVSISVVTVFVMYTILEIGMTSRNRWLEQKFRRALKINNKEQFEAYEADMAPVRRRVLRMGAASIVLFAIATAFLIYFFS